MEQRQQQQAGQQGRPEEGAALAGMWDCIIAALGDRVNLASGKLRGYVGLQIHCTVPKLSRLLACQNL